MNEIEAELAGEIVQFHPGNGQPVQYGDPLFTIKPEK
jgi:biotin carboxyl carrier protein